MIILVCYIKYKYGISVWIYNCQKALKEENALISKVIATLKLKDNNKYDQKRREKKSKMVLYILKRKFYNIIIT